MKPKRILVAYLILVAGLFLAAALAGPTASLATGPAPTETPQGPVKVPFASPLDLAARPASRPMQPVQIHFDSASIPFLSVRPAVLTNNGTGWQRIEWQDFEGTLTDPPWRSTDFSSTDGGEYLWGQRDCKALSGGHSLWAGGGGLDGGSLACGETYADNLLTWLRYGPIDLSQVTDAELQFSLWADVEGNEQGPILIDKISWLASIDGSTTYYGYSSTGQTGDWIPERLNLSSVPGLGDITGEPEVYLGWVFDTDGSNPINYEGAFADDAALWVYTDPLPTPPPTPTLPITRHTTVADFAGGRSYDGTVVEAEQGDGALILTAQVNTLADWGRLPSLPSALFDFATVTAKEHLFVIGGNIPGGQYQRRAYSAVIQDDGLLGHWVEVTELPQALTAHTAVVANDHLFVLGGFNANGFQATVFSARINDDGTLGEWNTTLPALPEPLAVNASVSVHGYLYVLGGRKSNEPVIVSDKIYRAKVNADGTLGDWETLATELPHSSMWHEAVATCDHLYVIAGQDQVINEYSAVHQAEIHPDGSLGAWDETAALPKTLAAHAAVAIHGGILVTGGWSSPDPVFSPQRNVYWAPLGPDCSLGSWVELTPPSYRTYKHALAATDRYIYNLGGVSTASRTLASVLRAPLQLGDSSVQQGVFNHQFYLGDNYAIESLRWTEEGSGDTEISLRYRVGNTYNGEYGPWSDYTSTNPITVNAIGGFLEYQLKFEGGNGLSDKYVTEVSLNITPLDSVYLPLVVKD